MPSNTGHRHGGDDLMSKLVLWDYVGKSFPTIVSKLSALVLQKKFTNYVDVYTGQQHILRLNLSNV